MVELLAFGDVMYADLCQLFVTLVVTGFVEFKLNWAISHYVSLFSY